MTFQNLLAFVGTMLFGHPSAPVPTQSTPPTQLRWDPIQFHDGQKYRSVDKVDALLRLVHSNELTRALTAYLDGNPEGVSDVIDSLREIFDVPAFVPPAEWTPESDNDDNDTNEMSDREVLKLAMDFIKYWQDRRDQILTNDEFMAALVDYMNARENHA